ncbi:MAG: 2-hydroxyacid dehydrogenase [Hyphomicrobiales bacterium]|nr:2-hydroxyacid dehydrogenase [Hyphomicrobiales bacterium]
MSMPEILVTDPFIALVHDGLRRAFTTHDIWNADDVETVLASVAGNIRGIACGHTIPFNPDFIDRFPKLEIIANFGVGYDNIDADYAATRNIVVTNTPDVLTEEVADTAIGLMIMTARELSASERWLRAGNWDDNYPLTRGTLRGKKLGIFGLGRIGKAIAQRAEAINMEVSYHNRDPMSDVSYCYFATLADLASHCDVLLCAAPGGPATRHIINADILSALGPDGIFINIGRGSTVDESALIEALRDGTIMSAGLDVFEFEPQVPQALIDMDHVVLLPHVASASQHTRDAMGQLQVDNLVQWFERGKPVTPVAETPWPRR